MKTEPRFCADDLADLIETENMGAPGLIASLIVDFDARLETYLSEIDSALRTTNYKDLKRFTHTLKSSTRVLGLRAASEICKQMELEAAQGRGDAAQFALLRAEVVPALDELRAFDLNRKKG